MPTREQKRLETRQRLYEAAMAIFRRDGVAACRIDDIAKAARVSRGSFYFHFPTKEHVLLERMRETEDEICGQLALLPANASIPEVLAALGEALANIWEKDPQLLPEVAGAALRSTASAMWDQEATQLRSVLAKRFRNAAERGEIEGRLPPQNLSDFYLGNTLGGLLAWYGNPVLPLRDVLAAVTDLFWNGAKAPEK